jgi:hypothetical protein
MGFFCGTSIKEKWQAKGMCELQSFNKVTKND